MQMYGMSGEPLGLIGRSKDESQGLPDWKKDFLSKPSVSYRRGIAWGFEKVFEDTDTIVLTAPSGKFVDIRFPKDAKTAEDAVKHPSYWIFSGEVKTTFYDADTKPHAVDVQYTAHCVFVQDIDSRGLGFVDEGDMYTLPNGETLEIGMMANEETGKNELYKEYWVSANPLPESNDFDDAKSVTLAVASDEKGIRGNLMRIGGRIQGVVTKIDDSGERTVAAVRWLRDTNTRTRAPSDSEESDVSIAEPTGNWQRDDRSTTQLPCGWLTQADRQIGDKVEFEGLTWEIAEKA